MISFRGQIWSFLSIFIQQEKFCEVYCERQWPAFRLRSCRAVYAYYGLFLLKSKRYCIELVL